MQKLIFACSLLWLAVSSCGKDNTITHPPLDPSLDTHITGYVRNTDRTPLSNIEIIVYRATQTPTTTWVEAAQTTSDANGYYQIAFDTDTASNVKYYIYCYALPNRTYGDQLVFKDSIYQKDFWICPHSIFRMEFQDDPNLNSDYFQYIIQLPSGCFEQVAARRFLSTTGFAEYVSTSNPRPYVQMTNSGGYTRYTTMHFYQGQLFRTKVDSVYMNPNATSTVFIPY